MAVFTDKMDLDSKISLYEYGIIRNPKTDKCVVCINIHALETSFGDLLDDSPKPEVRVKYISFNDVREALEDVSLGYFEFIGGNQKEELQNLDNKHLTYYIYSLEQYCGWFQLSQGE